MTELSILDQLLRELAVWLGNLRLALGGGGLLVILFVLVALLINRDDR